MIVQQRALREQQDREYRESLEKDQQKNDRAQAVKTRKEMMEQLKVKLISKQRPHLRRTKSLTFRLASGERLEELFDPEESTKAL